MNCFIAGGRRLAIIILLFTGLFAVAQDTVTVMTYNILNFGNAEPERIPYLKMVLDSTQPDILVVQEILSQGAITLFREQVLNQEYLAGTFIDGPDSDNGIFYKNDLFTFISNVAIPTALRDINEFTMIKNATGDTLRIYAVHLKASSGTTNENKRLQEVTQLREVTDALPEGSDFIVCGDFNIYKSTEPAYEALLTDDGISDGHFIDPVDMTGTWNNEAYAYYHTQSTRARQFGGGSTGGLDDRFDLILFSQAIAGQGGMTYIQNSTRSIGNDGNHYNDSINAPPNTMVSQAFANALHYASDHLPVLASFTFEETTISMQIDLNSGWNAISSYLQPVDAKLSSVLAPIDSDFIILFNDDGSYFPGAGIQTITNWSPQSGYFIKVSESCVLPIDGFPVEEPVVSVNAGWNTIPVITDEPVLVEELLMDNLSSVIIIREVAGPHLYWPEKHINSLPYLMPGKAYLLKSSGDFEIIF